MSFRYSTSISVLEVYANTFSLAVTPTNGLHTGIDQQESEPMKVWTSFFAPPENEARNLTFVAVDYVYETLDLGSGSVVNSVFANLSASCLDVGSGYDYDSYLSFFRIFGTTTFKKCELGGSVLGLYALKSCSGNVVPESSLQVGAQTDLEWVLKGKVGPRPRNGFSERARLVSGPTFFGGNASSSSVPERLLSFKVMPSLVFCSDPVSVCDLLSDSEQRFFCQVALEMYIQGVENDRSDRMVAVDNAIPARAITLPRTVSGRVVRYDSETLTMTTQQKVHFTTFPDEAYCECDTRRSLKCNFVHDCDWVVDPAMDWANRYHDIHDIESAEVSGHPKCILEDGEVVFYADCDDILEDGSCGCAPDW